MDFAKEKIPDELIFGAQVSSFDFSPLSQPYISCSLVDGHVYVYQYAIEENKLAIDLKPFKKACRAVNFSDDGTMLFCAGSDGSLKEIDLNKATISWGQGKVHDYSINCMKVNSGRIFTGDEEGGVKVWDQKSKKLIFSWEEHQDYVSDMAFLEDKLFTSSADGTLVVYDLKAGKFEIASESLDDELLSLAFVKNGNTLLAGTLSGSLQLFSSDNWGWPVNSFKGHPESIDAMVAVNEDIIITGSSDGLIRVCNIHPHELMGVIGEHQGFPIENLALSKDLDYLVSSSHDNTIKFWNISCFWSEEGANFEVEEKKEKKLQKQLKQTKQSKQKRKMRSFFSDL